MPAVMHVSMHARALTIQSKTCNHAWTVGVENSTIVALSLQVAFEQSKSAINSSIQFLSIE